MIFVENAIVFLLLSHLEGEKKCHLYHTIAMMAKAVCICRTGMIDLDLKIKFPYISNNRSMNFYFQELKFSFSFHCIIKR